MSTIKEKVKDMLAKRIPPRRSEIPFIRKMRMLVLYSFYTCVGIYFCYKAYKLAKDERTLTYEQKNSGGGILPPVAYFLASYNFTIDCTQVFVDETTLDCSQYIIPNVFDPESGYIGGVNAFDLQFRDPTIDQENINASVLFALALSINITDSTYTANTDASMIATFFDQKTDIALSKADKHRSVFKSLNDYESTADSSNIYFVSQYQSYDLLYERKVHKRLEQSAVNRLSGNGGHLEITLIDSIFVPYPADHTYYATVSIRPRSYVVTVETENSNLSAIDLFSSTGGIYSFVTTLYVFLFGVKAMGPWGLVQKLPRVRDNVKDTLRKSLRPSIPFSDSVLSGDLSVDQKFETMEKRQLALELFLKEYVVNVDYIAIADDKNVVISVGDDNNKEIV